MVTVINWSAVKRAVAALLLLTATGVNAQNVTGSYVGLYACDHRQHTFSVEFGADRKGSITAEASFPNQVIKTTGFNARSRMRNRGKPIEMKVQSATNSSIAIQTKSKIVLIPQQSSEQVTLTGSRETNGYLTGELDYPGCGRFVLVPTTVRGPETAAHRYMHRLWQADELRAREQQILAAREARLRSGWIPPELRPTGGRIEYPSEPLEYYDVTLGRADDPYEDIRPVDRAMQRLVDKSYKCIGTAQVRWRGNEGSATSAIFGTKVYLIECEGHCDGLTYKSPSVGSHFGKSLPYPAVQLSSRGPGLGSVPISWQFNHVNEHELPPRVRVHTWSNQLGDYGGQCVID